MVNVIGIGGCGVNTATDVVNRLRSNKNFDKVNAYKLYSSDDNESQNDSGLEEVTKPLSFDVSFRFTSTDVDKTILRGSGGDRKENLFNYIPGVKQFINELKNKPLHKAITGEAVNILLFSGSKGTGSTAGPIMIKYLTELNIPFFAVLVVDNTDEITIINCINTIKTINNFAKTTNSNPLVYVAQNNVDGKTEIDVNKDISDVCEVMAFMGIGKANELDESDYNSLIDIRKYSSLKMKPTAMVLSLLAKDEYNNLKTVTKFTPVIARYIKENKSVNHGTVRAKHSATGYAPKNSFKLETPIVITNSLGIQYYIDALEDTFNEVKTKIEVKDIVSTIDLNKDNIDDGISIVNPNDDIDEDEWHQGFIL